MLQQLLYPTRVQPRVRVSLGLNEHLGSGYAAERPVYAAQIAEDRGSSATRCVTTGCGSISRAVLILEASSPVHRWHSPPAPKCWLHCVLAANFIAKVKPTLPWTSAISHEVYTHC